jgi:predicted dehydrogenase
MTALRIGIVGCGMIAGTPLRNGRPIAGNHAAACRAVPGVQLVSAAEPDPGRREAFGREWDVPQLYSSATEMLERANLDLVIVATSPDSHEAACKEALSRGVRGILCEKPFTGSAAGARRVVDACRAAGCKLVVNFTRRWDEAHRALAAGIAAGEIGEVTLVRGTYTGAIRGNGSHFIDTLLMLVAGPWRLEWASQIAADADDGPIDAVLRNETARAFVSVARNAEYFVFEIELFGTRGRARAVLHGNDIRIELPQAQERYPGYQFLAEARTLPRGTMDHASTHALDALASAVRSGREPDVAAEEHVASLMLLDTIVNRARARGEDAR